MQNYARPVLALLLAAIYAADLGASEDNYLVAEYVVVRKTTGDSMVDSSRKVAYYPAEIVRVLNKKRSLVLVQRVNESANFDSPLPSFGPDYENWRSTEQGPSWIPIQDVAGRSDFKKLDQWQGANSFVVCEAPCDFGTYYEVSADGSFKAETEGSATDMQRWSGHMYRLEKVVWAFESAYTRFSDYTVMVLSPRNEPCHVRDFSCTSGKTYP